MRRITIRRARTWHYTKMRPRIDRSNDLAPLSAFRSWLDCTINTSGCDFRKGQRPFLEGEADIVAHYSLASRLVSGDLGFGFTCPYAK